MKTKVAVFAGVLCLCSAAFLRAEGLTTFELSTNAASADILKARQALEQGAVVYMRLVDLRQFNADLAVQVPLRKLPVNEAGEEEGSQSCLAAAYLGQGSAITFVGPEVVNGHRPERDRCDAAFKRWLDKQNLLRGAPDSNTWTAQGANSRSFGSFSFDVNIYRATADDANNAYYMYTVAMTDTTASAAVRSCTINMQGLELQNQQAPAVWDHGDLKSSPGTPSEIGGTIPSNEGITPYQPDSWSGNPSTVSYTGTSQMATWVQQYSSGEGASEVRVAAAIFQVSRPSPVSVEVTTNCTDSSNNFTSQSDVTYTIAPPDLLVPSDVYVVAGSSIMFTPAVTPGRNQSFDWSPSLSNSNVTLTQSGNNITISAPLSSLGTTTGINYNIDPTWATTTLVPATLVHVVSTPPQAGVLLAGGSGVNSEPLATADVWDANTSQVTPTNSPMSTTRYRHTATAIDATHILVAGGFGGANNAAQASTDIYNVTTGLFAPGPNMSSARAGHTATILTGPNTGSQYLVLAGGVDQNGSPVGTLDIYDLTNQVFLPSVLMATARYNHAAAAQTNQMIVITGGSQSANPTTTPISATEACSINSADIISCGAGGGLQTARQGHATAVFDFKTAQQVYVFGGFNSTQNDPENCHDPLCTWEVGGGFGQFVYTRYYTAFTSWLPNGIGLRNPAVLPLASPTNLPIPEPKFLFIGGDNSPKQVLSCTILTRFDCDSGFGATVSMATVRSNPVAVPLTFIGSQFDNKVLIAGGVDLSAVPVTDNGTEIEVYDSAQNTIAVQGNMSSPRMFMTGTAFQVNP